MRKGLFFLMTLGILFAACRKENVDQAMVDKEIILQYLTDNNLNATEHSSGMFYLITNEGTGSESPNINSNVEVKYPGYSPDGTTFDQTQGDSTATFALAGVIEGWQIAIPLLKKNGKGTFLFPSELGYGSSSRPGIPRNSVLIFDVELVDFN